MGFFGKLFGNDDETPARKLNHPSQLNVGDMITLDDSFALPPQLRGQQLRVELVNTYEFEREHTPEWVLKGKLGDTLFMGLDDDDEVWLSFSIKLPRADVEALFDMDAFAEIFAEPGEAELTPLPLTKDTEIFEQWLGERYYQTGFARFGYFHKKDYRNGKPSQYVEDNPGEPFESYELLDSQESHAIEIEVYEGGDTDVMLTLYRPLSDIREYWPGD